MFWLTVVDNGGNVFENQSHLQSPDLFKTKIALSVKELFYDVSRKRGQFSNEIVDASVLVAR